MDQVIDLKSPVYSSPPDEIASWSTLATVKAAMKSLAGMEKFEANREISEAWVQFHVRYRSDVTTVMRVVHRAITYDIRDVQDIDGKRENLLLRCRAVR